MRIAIVGVGNVGSALAAAATKAGHEVTVTAAHPDHAEKVAKDTGATAAATVADAAVGADVLVLAVPATATTEVVRELGDAASGLVVVDPSNPLNDTYTDLSTSGSSVAEELAKQLPEAKVVKALNTIFASRHGNPTEDGQPLDGYYAGDDDAAKQKVAELLESLGFRPVDAGNLRMARTLEEMQLLNITLNARNGWSWQTGYRLAGPTG